MPFDNSQTDESGFPNLPAGWPGAVVVDLDNVGDPGFWIEELIPNPSEALFGDGDQENQLADELAYAYVKAAADLGFPLPSDFGATTEETYEDVKNDFLGFIREWRRLAVAQGFGRIDPSA